MLTIRPKHTWAAAFLPNTQELPAHFMHATPHSQARPKRLAAGAPTPSKWTTLLDLACKQHLILYISNTSLCSDFSNHLRSTLFSVATFPLFPVFLPMSRCCTHGGSEITKPPRRQSSGAQNTNLRGFQGTLG